MEADGDLAWEMSIKRYDALVKACEAAHNHRKWWLCHTERKGPSKHWGVRFNKPSWAVDIRIDGVMLHLGTCKCEGDAGLAADFARVALGLAPKNFTAPWDSIKAWVEAGGNGVVPVVERVELRGDVRVNGMVSVGASEAASSIEAEIKSAIASKPDLAEVLLDVPEWKRGFPLKGQQVIDLRAAGITTVAGLALADVDKPEHVRAVTTNRDESQARAAFWSKKHAAAKRLGVKIGSLPAKQRAAKKTSTKERPQAHQRVPDGVANCSVPSLIG